MELNLFNYGKVLFATNLVYAVAPSHRKRDQKQSLSAEDTTKQQNPPAYAFKLLFIEICFDAPGARDISKNVDFIIVKLVLVLSPEIKADSWRIEREILIEKICKLRYGKHRFIILSFEMNIASLESRFSADGWSCLSVTSHFLGNFGDIPDKTMKTALISLTFRSDRPISRLHFKRISSDNPKRSSSLRKFQPFP